LAIYCTPTSYEQVTHSNANAPVDDRQVQYQQWHVTQNVSPQVLNETEKGVVFAAVAAIQHVALICFWIASHPSMAVLRYYKLSSAAVEHAGYYGHEDTGTQAMSFGFLSHFYRARSTC
jgi:hypothetical protein